MPPNTLSLSTTALDCTFSRADSRLSLDRLGLPNSSAVLASADLFAMTLNDARLTAGDFTLLDATIDTPTPGVQRLTATLAGHGLEITLYVHTYAATGLVETWQELRSTASTPQTITRVDSIALDLPAGGRLDYYTSEWGAEFEPAQATLESAVILETRHGRSSKGIHPWFALTLADGVILSGAVAWSGNWAFRFEPDGDHTRLSGGLNDWEFAKTLRPGESMTTPIVVLVLGTDMNAVSQQYARVGRQHWYPRNALSRTLPVEWNHWWGYEDVDINETVFVANVDEAAALGMEICTLDAGWFGPSDAGSNWTRVRGDWHLVNADRFPHGIRPIADATHARGMKFGFWCEIEGLGADAALAQEHPELAALRDGERLGYVCFGNPETQEWAFQTLSRIIAEYDADWLKLDFNLDPFAGCNRTDHGHGAGDGLYEHYRGYYRMLERLRAAFPHVILENCASGGLRIDLGILRQTHLTFLSDQDWPIHSLQVFWGATTMLAPDACLHWSFSDWRGESRPVQQNFDPRDPNLTATQFDYYTRIAMLGLCGFSQKLPTLPGWIQDRLQHHIAVYKEHVRRFVRDADLYRLTAQPKRSGDGERWSAFQYSLPDASEHLLFVFRLPGAEPERRIRLQNLAPERVYSVVGFEGEATREISGRALMDSGLLFATLPEEGSALLLVR